MSVGVNDVKIFVCCNGTIIWCGNLCRRDRRTVPLSPVTMEAPALTRGTPISVPALMALRVCTASVWPTTAQVGPVLQGERVSTLMSAPSASESSPSSFVSPQDMTLPPACWRSCKVLKNFQSALCLPWPFLSARAGVYGAGWQQVSSKLCWTVFC